jgi:hypothetical protein
MLLVMVAVASIGMSCSQAMSSVFERSAEARHLAAALQTHFASAVDTTSRAPIAHDAEASSLLEAERARAQVKRTEDQLASLLRDLGYTDEAKLLEEFRAKFAAYEVLDRSAPEHALEKRTIVSTCEESLRALNESLTERVARPTR